MAMLMLLPKDHTCEPPPHRQTLDRVFEGIVSLFMSPRMSYTEETNRKSSLMHRTGPSRP